VLTTRQFKERHPLTMEVVNNLNPVSKVACFQGLRGLLGWDSFQRVRPTRVGIKKGSIADSTIMVRCLAVPHLLIAFKTFLHETRDLPENYDMDSEFAKLIEDLSDVRIPQFLERRGSSFVSSL